jgi:hypothetical protein
VREVDDLDEIVIGQHSDEHHRPEERIDDRLRTNGGDQIERQVCEVTEHEQGGGEWS